MKTIMDAVKEFKGDFPNNLIDCHGWTYAWFRDEIVDAFNFEGDVVCTYEEFYTLVHELSTNMGRATQTYAEYKASYQFKDLDYDEINNKIAVMDKPVYTQAMCDKGELPSVGMECLSALKSSNKDIWFNFTPYYVGSKYIVGYWKQEDREASFGILSLKFKPLTPPIKLIDGMAYQFDYVNNNGTYRGIYNEKEDRFIIAYGHVMVSYCTNIKLLTPEGE